MTPLIEGILNINKPTGLTSHDIVNQARRMIGIRRVGHTGTLDPLATGVLVLCIGRATRLSEYLLGQNKIYEATVCLGQETNTYDAEGEVVAEKPVNVSRDQLDAALDRFRGPINQLPPMYSAVKVGGRPLYKYAREDQEVTRPSRQVTVYDLELQTWQTPELRLRIVCSSGTYIRSIAHDLGQILGCGGYLAVLRRMAVGNFSIEEASLLSDLDSENWQEFLEPLDMAIAHLQRLNLTNEEAEKLFHGQPVACRPGQPEDLLVRAYDESGQFVGVLIKPDGQWQAKKIFYQPGQ
jgi:tRNA pseudouridine55 synthase